MVRILRAIALLGAVASAHSDSDKDSKHVGKTTTEAHEMGVVGMNMLFPPNWTPKHVAASVVEADKEKAQTTFALGCADDKEDCSVYFKTMTQGPKTWAYTGEWKSIQGVDEYTLKNHCKLDLDGDDMTCTMAVTQVKDDKTASTATTGTTSNLADHIYPIPITAGAKKIGIDQPKATSTTEAKPKHTSESEHKHEHSKHESKEHKHKHATTSHPHKTATADSAFVMAAPQITSLSFSAPLRPVPASQSDASSSSDAPPTPAVETPGAGNAAPAQAPTRIVALAGVALLGAAIML